MQEPVNLVHVSLDIEHSTGVIGEIGSFRNLRRDSKAVQHRLFEIRSRWDSGLFSKDLAPFIRALVIEAIEGVGQNWLYD